MIYFNFFMKNNFFKLLLYLFIILNLIGCNIVKKTIKNNFGKKTYLLKIPCRDSSAMTGSKFAAYIDRMTLQDRETAVINEISKGNVPDLLRKFIPINTSFTDDKGNVFNATYFVTTDYLSIGSDEDYFRVPITPKTAQKIADILDCSLITRKISDDIYKNAEIKLEPKPLTEKREAVSSFLQHHQIIEEQRKNLPFGKLIAGIKKDVVVTNRLKEKPNRVAIYGWHKLDGKPIQPLSTVHVNTYVDYSHGIRLIFNKMIVDGKEMDVSDVLNHPILCKLISDEGVIENSKY